MKLGGKMGYDIDKTDVYQILKTFSKQYKNRTKQNIKTELEDYFAEEVK